MKVSHASRISKFATFITTDSEALSSIEIMHLHFASFESKLFRALIDIANCRYSYP
jgi:hypothetical protein